MSLLMNATMFAGGDECMGDIFNITDEKQTFNAGTIAATLFTGKGILLRVVVDRAQDGAYLTVTENDGTDTYIRPDLDVKGTLAYGFSMGQGCVVNASNLGATGLVHAFYRHEDA